MSTLIIVESPTKAKKIQGYLGAGYVVRASYGHIADLPKKSFGIDLDNLEESYEILPQDKTRQVIRQLKEEVGKASQVLLATDPDREGEAIAWHLQRVLKLPANTQRIEIHEITQPGIKKAMSAARPVGKDLIEAQRARRVIDRLLGYGISPALMRAVTDGRSAGRVQSAALRLIVERDREIANFVARDRFQLVGQFNQGGTAFEATLQQTPAALALAQGAAPEEGEENARGALVAASRPDQLEAALRQIRDWGIQSVKDKEVSVAPPPPLTTSTLQQLGARRLGWSGEQTMKIAQTLFENGHITYMRTDSVRVAPEAQEEAIAYLSQMDPALAPSKPNTFKSKGGAQDAHEAIRPAHIADETVMSGEAAALYALIRERFLASQAAAGKNAVREVLIQDGQAQYSFLSRQTQISSPGWRAISRPEQDDALAAPLAVTAGACALQELQVKASKTKPKPRYREDSLIMDLERMGIGRPSSYAGVMKTLTFRKYVQRKGQEIQHTQLGGQVLDWLVKSCPQFVDLQYTASMEAQLDAVAEGKAGRKPLLVEVRDALVAVFGPLDRGGLGGEASDKQRALIEKLAATQGLTVPEDVLADRNKAREFIDASLSTQPPSEKQIAFARSLAEKNGKDFTETMAASAKLTSAFISEMLGKSGKPTGGKKPGRKPGSKTGSKSAGRSSGPSR